MAFMTSSTQQQTIMTQFSDLLFRGTMLLNLQFKW